MTPRARSSPRNNSPDISFDQSINPYRGCEHGCSYCFARPTHAYMGLSPGLDFETKLFAKPNAAELLEQELSTPGYVPKTIAIGTNTDPYQPIEREYRIMRGILEVLDRVQPSGRHRHQVGAGAARSRHPRRDGRAQPGQGGAVGDHARSEARARRWSRAPRRRRGGSAPSRRSPSAGIPTAVMVAPIIPGLNDNEIERILKAAAAAGVKNAGYVLLRLPLEVKDLFREWLMSELPDRASRVMSLIRDMRGGKEYDSTFGRRMTGTGPYAWTIGRRFELACDKLGLNSERTSLTTEHFKRPPQPGEQMSLL